MSELGFLWVERDVEPLNTGCPLCAVNPWLSHGPRRGASGLMCEAQRNCPKHYAWTSEVPKTMAFRLFGVALKAIPLGT